jgi:hypothetical protein
MLRMAARHSGEMEIGELVMECATAYDGGLAWCTAGRTAGSLVRRYLMEVRNGVVVVTPAGYAALTSVLR